MRLDDPWTGLTGCDARPLFDKADLCMEELPVVEYGTTTGSGDPCCLDPRSCWSKEVGKTNEEFIDIDMFTDVWYSSVRISKIQ